MMKWRLWGAINLLVPVLCLGATVEIKRQRPDDQLVRPLPQKITETGPDERVLWRLFHAGKLTELNRQIEFLRRAYPRWRIPPDLAKALASRSSSVPKPAVSGGSRKPSPDRLARSEAVSCLDRHRLRQRAEAAVASRRLDRALPLFRRLLGRCRAPREQMWTLERAASVFGYDDFLQLAALVGTDLSRLYLDRLRYDVLKRLYLSIKKPNSRQQAEYVPKLDKLITPIRDDALAAVVGWRYYDLHDDRQAAFWFQRAATWNPHNSRARFGLLLSLERLGQYDRLLAVTEAAQAPTADMRAVAGRVYRRKAWQALAANDPIVAADNLTLAEQMAGSDAETKELKAWLAQKNKRYGRAAILFDELYRQSPKRKFARAYVQNQASADRQVLTSRSVSAGGSLAEEYRRYSAGELYQRKQFLSAYKQFPPLTIGLQQIDTASARLGGYVRSKSGEVGLSRLDIFRQPIAGFNYNFAGIHSFGLNLSRIRLYSGGPSACQADIGSLTPHKDNCRKNNRFFSPTESLNNGFEANLYYRKDGWFSPFVALGTTPIGGVIAPTLTFDLGFVQQTGHGYWSLQSYSQPVRQSMLSYTGIRDPYRGNTGGYTLQSPHDTAWGRVLATGVQAMLFNRFNEFWGIFGRLNYAFVHGKNVANNNKVSFSVSLGRNIPMRGFNYFSIGPAFSYMHFDKNLSAFTLGNGGYFSPDRYINVGMGVNFLTEEGRPYVIKGYAAAGYQSINNASAAWFPLLNPGLGSYAASHSSGESLNIALQGVWLVAPRIQLGGAAAMRKNYGFEDYTGGLFVRFLFDARKASFSTDIPASQLNDMYTMMY